MGLTVSQCEKLLAQAPAEKVKKHPAGDGLYFVVGRGRAYWSYQFRRGASWSAKGLGGYPEFSPKDARDRLKHWQVTGSLPGESPREHALVHQMKPQRSAFRSLKRCRSGLRSLRRTGATRAQRCKLVRHWPNFAYRPNRSTGSIRRWCSAISCPCRLASVKTFGCGLPPCWISQKAKSGGRGTPMRATRRSLRTSVAACGPSLRSQRTITPRCPWADLPGAHGQAVGRQVGPVTSAHVDNLNGGPHGGH